MEDSCIMLSYIGPLNWPEEDIEILEFGEGDDIETVTMYY